MDQSYTVEIIVHTIRSELRHTRVYATSLRNENKNHVHGEGDLKYSVKVHFCSDTYPTQF